MDTFLCPHCKSKIHYFSLAVANELEENFLDELRACAHYQSPIPELIFDYKYKGVKAIHKTIAKLLLDSCQFPQVDCLSFVPLHPKKFLSREFNQAALIALELGKNLDTPCLDLLQRTVHLSAQASVSDRKERAQRVDKIFSLNKKYSEKIPKSVLLIDDVTTTGSTLNACARVLKEAGVEKVFGLVLAHGG